MAKIHIRFRTPLIIWRWKEKRFWHKVQRWHRRVIEEGGTVTLTEETSTRTWPKGSTKRDDT